MKKRIVIIVSILLLTGCRNDMSTGKGISGGNTVEKVIDAQINQGQQTNETETAVTETVAEITNTETQDMENENVEAERVNPEDQTTVDYDLTQMSSDMVYATVYQLMVKPDEYPEDNAKVIIEGTFETYREEGDASLYCRLADATLEKYE